MGCGNRITRFPLAAIEVNEDASRIRLTEVGVEFPLDDQAERSLANYLGSVGPTSPNAPGPGRDELQLLAASTRQRAGGGRGGGRPRGVHP